jgi:hypothetical protein
MFSFLKYIPLLLKFKDVTEVYKEETGQDKPWYLSRTFLGSAIAFIFTCLAVFFGIVVDAGTIQIVVDNISTIISAIVALYGIIMTFIGQIKKKPIVEKVVEKCDEDKPIA